MSEEVRTRIPLDPSKTYLKNWHKTQDELVSSLIHSIITHAMLMRADVMLALNIIRY